MVHHPVLLRVQRNRCNVVRDFLEHFQVKQNCSVLFDSSSVRHTDSWLELASGWVRGNEPMKNRQPLIFIAGRHYFHECRASGYA
jgi:hypothetical protein